MMIFFDYKLARKSIIKTKIVNFIQIYKNFKSEKSKNNEVLKLFKRGKLIATIIQKYAKI